MLNTFPSLLIYGFYAPLLLRAAVAVVLVWAAWHAWQARAQWRHAPLPLIGPQSWMPTVAALGMLALGAMFLFGWHTQIAAVLGIIGMLKFAAYRRWWPKALEAYFPLSAGAAFLVFVICLSLLLTGAGALAYDLPL